MTRELQITSEEKKLAVLELSKAYPPTEISKMLGISVKKVNDIRDLAMRELFDRSDDMGRALAAMEIERLQDVARTHYRLATEIGNKVLPPGEEVDLDALVKPEVKRAIDTFMQSSDRLVKISERTAKLLGLDAPTKIEPVGFGGTPDRIMDEAVGEVSELIEHDALPSGILDDE